MNKNESKYFNTAKKMNDALVALLDRKDYEYITIKDICKEANVNRSTFYLHYANVNDLLEEVIQSMNSSFVSHFGNNETSVSIVNKNNVSDLYLIKDEFLLPYLDFIKENRKVYKAVKNHPELFNARSTYETLFKSLFSPIMTRFGLDEKWHKYMMDFYMAGLSSVIIDWVLSDCEAPSQEICDLIKKVVVKYDRKDNSESKE